MEQQDEIFGFFEQSRISGKNVARLKQLVESPNPEIVEYGGLSLKWPGSSHTTDGG